MKKIYFVLTEKAKLGETIFDQDISKGGLEFLPKFSCLFTFQKYDEIFSLYIKHVVYYFLTFQKYDETLCLPFSL